MPRIDQRISVSTSDKGKVGEKRKLTIEVEADSGMFLLSDLLVQEGVLRDLKSFLATASRSAVGEYILSGRKLVKEAGAKEKKNERGGEKRAGQDKRTGAKAS